MTALNLVEAAKLHLTNGEYKKAGVTMAFAEGTPLLAAIPAVSINGNAYSWNEEGVLPGIAARAVGENYTASAGVVTQRTEALKVYGGLLNVDRVTLKTLGEDKRAVHEQMKAKALGQALGYDLIEGNSTTSASKKVIDGLKARYSVSHAQTIDQAGAAGSMKEIDQIREMVSNPTHWLMTRQSARLINAYLRSSGTAVRMEKDAYGQPLMFYGDLPILIADPIDVASGYRGLADAAGDDDANNTSIFCLSLSETGLHLIQSPEGLAIEDVGQTDEGTGYNTLVEWIVGLADEGPHSGARYSNVDADGAIVA
jgi:hypothetical protein